MDVKLIADHFYKINDRGEIHIGQYTGTDNGFECCVCGKGHKAKCFNIWYSEEGYETWGFGASHMPEIIEDLGTEVILDREV